MLSAAKLFVVGLIGVILLEGATPGHAAVRRYKFELRYTPYTRLCTNKTILTINGQFPGPTIYARRGDLVIVDVINRANHNITIHWHGVKLPRNPWSDGAAHVTQCPITPGNRFTQRVTLSDEEGTLWWHAHSGWTRSTVHGAIIILPPKNEVYPFPKPDAEFPIILGEWWNDDVQYVYEKFVHGGHDAQPSDALLINSLPGNMYTCSTQDIFKLRVEFGKTYLIRMINAVMANFMYFKIANHNFTVVGNDGAYRKPFTTDIIGISPGQTVDFLLEANQPPNLYYMASRILAGAPGLQETPTTGYLEYTGNYSPPTSLPLPDFPPVNSTLEVENFNKALKSLANDRYPIDVPMNVAENLYYTLAMNLLPCTNPHCDGSFRLRTSINNVSFVLPSISFLEAYYNNISGVYETDFPDHPLFPYNYTQDNLPEKNPFWATKTGTKVKILDYNSTVELVLQGTSQGRGVQHAIHLHGYGVYLVGSGNGNFDRSTDPANYNLVDPPLMQTVAVPKNGWTAIRFRANNPGVWVLHCHYERHFSWGMGMVFIVKDGTHPSEKMLPPPPDMPFCMDPSTLPSVKPTESSVEVDAV